MWVGIHVVPGPPWRMNSMPMHEWCLGFWWECRFSSLHGRWAAGAGLGMSANARSSGNTCVQNVKESRSELRTHKHGQGETSLAVKAIGGRESSEPMRLCDFQESWRPNHILLLPSLWNTILYRHNMGQTTRRYLAIQSCPRARLNRFFSRCFELVGTRRTTQREPFWEMLLRHTRNLANTVHEVW